MLSRIPFETVLQYIQCITDHCMHVLDPAVVQTQWDAKRGISLGGNLPFRWVDQTSYRAAFELRECRAPNAERQCSYVH
jgi:hypothetical protein